MTIITPTGITGITSITSSGNSLSFHNASGASIDVSGLKVAADSMNVSGIVTASRLNVGTGGTIISTTVNGSVGIGTTNSTQKLQVYGGSLNVFNPTGEVNIQLQSGDGNSVTAFRAINTNKNYRFGIQSSNQFVFRDATTSDNRLGITSTGEVIIGYTATPLVTTGTASQPLQVTGGAYVSGNLGIGTTNPETTLHTYSTSQASNRFQYHTPTTLSTSTICAEFKTSSNSLSVGARTGFQFVLQEGSNSYTGAYIQSVRENSSHHQGLSFSTWNGSAATPSERIRVTKDGYVGIGTNNPSTEFEVFGTGTVASFRGTGGSGFISIKDEDDGTFGFIGVDGGSIKLQTSGSSYADKLVVDSSGRVTKPYQPFVAGGSASGAISGNSNHVWATSGYVWSNVGNHWNASTGRFTAPVAGVYQVTAAIRYSSVPVTPSYVYIYFLASYQSASGQPILLWSTQTESGGTYRPRILTAAMYMRANDYVEPRLYAPNGTISIDGSGTSQSDCFLNIYLLG